MELTERDNDLLMMIAYFGKSYLSVLEVTFFNDTSKQYARKRTIDVLANKYKLLKVTNTGLASPRSYVALSEAGRRYVTDVLGMFEEDVVQPYFSLATMKHNWYEQIVYYFLKKNGRDVKRTIIKNWSKGHKHTPDLMFEVNGKMNYVEVELNKKSPQKYVEIFSASIKDGANGMVYVCEDRAKALTIAGGFPKGITINIRFIVIDELVKTKELKFLKAEELK